MYTTTQEDDGQRLLCLAGMAVVSRRFKTNLLKYSDGTKRRCKQRQPGEDSKKISKMWQSLSAPHYKIREAERSKEKPEDTTLWKKQQQDAPDQWNGTVLRMQVRRSRREHAVKWVFCCLAKEYRKKKPLTEFCSQWQRHRGPKRVGEKLQGHGAEVFVDPEETTEAQDKKIWRCTK